MSDWISVKKKLPLSYGKVVIYLPKDSGGKEWDKIDSAVYSDSGFATDYGYSWNHLVTHWMPMVEDISSLKAPK